MTLDEARDAIGAQVTYRPPHAGAEPETGRIAHVTAVFVYVLYTGDDRTPKATAPELLELAP